MVIYDFDIRYRVFAFQAEADTILLIDTNAVLSLAIAAKLLQTIGGRNSQIFQTGGVIEHDQFAKGNFLNALRELCRKALMIYFFCFLTGKVLYHINSIAVFHIHVKQVYEKSLSSPYMS